jgi:hypothetical protein
MKLQEVLNGEDDRFYFFRQDDTKLIYFKKADFIFRFPEKDYLRSIELKYPPEGIETIEIFSEYQDIFSIDEVLSEEWTKINDNPIMLC